MEHGNPPLARLKYHLVFVGSIFAAYVFFRVGVQHFSLGIPAAIALGVGAWAVFGFVQGFLPILNFIGLPVAGFFWQPFGPWGYWLGGVSLVIFLLTQFRYVKSVS